jgi:hypothetical protein
VVIDSVGTSFLRWKMLGLLRVGRMLWHAIEAQLRTNRGHLATFLGFRHALLPVCNEMSLEVWMQRHVVLAACSRPRRANIGLSAGASLSTD